MRIEERVAVVAVDPACRPRYVLWRRPNIEYCQDASG